jgi:hypothetical protein
VCSCGKHACPPTPRASHYDPAIASEARQAYQGVFAPAKRVGAPDQWQQRDVLFDGLSSYVRYARSDESLVLGRLSRESVSDERDLGDHSLPHFALSLTGAHDFEHLGLGDRLHLGNRNGVLAGLLLSLLFYRI